MKCARARERKDANVIRQKLAKNENVLNKWKIEKILGIMKMIGNTLNIVMNINLLKW